MIAVIRKIEKIWEAGQDGDAAILRMHIGPSNDNTWEDTFDVLVCTTSWLSQKIQNDSPSFGIHCIFVEYISIPIIQNFLRRRIEYLVASTWQEIVTKIARIAYWQNGDKLLAGEMLTFFLESIDSESEKTRETYS